MIPFFSEIENIIKNIGFKNSSEIFSFLRKCNCTFYYERVVILPEANLNNLINTYNYRTDGFLFTCYSNYKMQDCQDQYELVYLSLIGKNDFLKLLKLKAFS